MLSIWDAEISETSAKFGLPFLPSAAWFVGIRDRDKYLHSNVLWSGRRMLNSLCFVLLVRTWSFVKLKLSLCFVEPKFSVFSDILRARNCLPTCLPASRSDKILVTKYNVHANRLIQCFSSTTFKHQQPWWFRTSTTCFPENYLKMGLPYVTPLMYRHYRQKGFNGGYLAKHVQWETSTTPQPLLRSNIVQFVIIFLKLSWFFICKNYFECFNTIEPF